MAGWVTVDGQRADKAGAAVRAEAAVDVRTRQPYVSRGGHKLAAALDAFAIDPTGFVCLDVGASTGGFTDCLLQRGAARVHAVDVGYGLLDQRLRSDPRVVVHERINARALDRSVVGEACDLVVADLSFISLTKVVPSLLPHLGAGGSLVLLVKPQFEARRGDVGPGGVVRDEALRTRIVEQCLSDLVDIGLERIATCDSPLRGAEGNLETLAHLRPIPGSLREAEAG